MRVFCDTSVLVAACLGEHPHHERAWRTLVRVKEGADEGAVAGHSLAETYSVLTRLPGASRVPGALVWELLARNVVLPFTVVTLSGKEYVKCLKQLALQGIEGGRVYDGLILAAAEKAGAQQIYTFNVSHFQALAPPLLRERVTAP